MPITPLSGVRISWLILARNSLLARLAFSAASLAWRSSASACFRAVMSRMNAVKVHSPPDHAGVIATSTGNSRPSRRTATISATVLSNGPSPVLRNAFDLAPVRVPMAFGDDRLVQCAFRRLRSGPSGTLSPPADSMR